jgi:carbamate kinase
MTPEAQRTNVRRACQALAPIALEHELIISHGNGPQVGLLALQGAAYRSEEASPLDVLGAATEGSIGYLIELELGNLLPFEVQLGTILTMIEVDPADPAFSNPTKPIGPVYTEAEAMQLAADRGFVMKRDGAHYRRVVASPEPKRIFELKPIQWLLGKGCVVICAGGGGIPTMYEPGRERWLTGVEAVIDKDRASALLATDLKADLLVLATDVDGVYLDWGTPQQRRLECVTPEELSRHSFPDGSMGPKVDAAARFVRLTGRRAAIGALDDLAAMIDGTTGTRIDPGATTAPEGAAGP